MTDKIQLRKQFRELENMVYEWNPIGIPGLPEDEYSCVTPGIHIQLSKGVSFEELTNYLNLTTREHFGLDVTPEVHAHNQEYAIKFVEWFTRHAN